MKDVDRFSAIGVVVLAGNAKIHKQRRRKKRRGFFLRLLRPRYWLSSRIEFESRLSSKINRDDYIVGENKSLLYIHPDLIPQKNVNFLKRALYFAGKTGDRFYRKNKKDLLEYLSKEGKTSIYMVLKAILSSKENWIPRCEGDRTGRLDRREHIDRKKWPDGPGV